MNTAVPDKTTLADALVAEFTAFGELLAGLPDEAWRTPTKLPGWTVHDTVAHVIGTEEMLLGEPTPDTGVDTAALDHVHNVMGAFNENWVVALREHTPSAMRARYDAAVARRSRALSEATQEDFDAPADTPAGPATYGRFMRIRLFDVWMHDQDIRDVVGEPGNAQGPCAELASAEIIGALGYLVGKRAGAPDGAGVTIELTGSLRRALHVAVDGRASLVPELPGRATTTLRLDSGLFRQLAGGRVVADDELPNVTIEGDRELGERVVRALPFTI